MNTTYVGRRAEQVVARYLIEKGYKIIAQNWKIKTCEIDLIAYKDKTIYFVEVKYRSTTSQGGGIDYITPAKLKRMRFAASMWTFRYRWTGMFALSCAGVNTRNQVDFIEDIV